jgi:hypothetical protein
MKTLNLISPKKKFGHYDGCKMDYPKNYNYIKTIIRDHNLDNKNISTQSTENKSIKFTYLNHIDPKIINPFVITIISIKLIRK